MKQHLFNKQIQLNSEKNFVCWDSTNTSLNCKIVIIFFGTNFMIY